MNRTDELTENLIDGTLTDADANELHSLMEADPNARGRHLALVRLELVLRGLRTEFGFAEATVARIQEDRVERTTEAVMTGLAEQPPPAWGRRSGRGRYRLMAISSLTAAMFIGIWIASRTPHAPVAPPGGVPTSPEFARLTIVAGSVDLVGPDGPIELQPDQLLKPGQTLRTVGDESIAVLEFADRTRVEVHPETAVRFDTFNDTPTSPRTVFLVQGRVTATATGRSIVVATGSTEVEASRGSFSLWSSGLGSARVEPRDGDVRVVRTAPTEPVVLTPGQAAFVRDELTPVRIEFPMRVDSRPSNRLNFPSLDVGFTPDGEVWAVSAKQWARWRPGTPDSGRIAFPPNVQNDGLASWLTPDRKAVAICRIDDREERVVVRELPSGDKKGEISVRVSEPRFLCIGSDASWVATLGGQKPNNRRVRAWDVTTGRERFSRELNNSATCLAGSFDGRWLAVGVSDLGKGADNAVVIFDSTTGEKAFDLSTGRKSIMSLAFTGDGRRLAAGFNGAIQIWDMTTRKLERTLEGFERVVTRLAYSPRNNLLAAGTADGQVWVWSVETGRRVQVIETGPHGVRSLAFSPDGKQLVTTTNKIGIAVWEVAPDPAKDDAPDT
jgi:hypothetical protein